MAFLVLLLSILLLPITSTEDTNGKTFRVIAPQIICPKNKDIVSEKPDITSVMVQARGGRHIDLKWTVRWTPIVKPTQRFTLLLWRSVRNLEDFLNREQPEPFLYNIDNGELLPDVEYLFNVTGIMENENVGTKSFAINNVSGKSKLLLNEGKTDKFSLVLLGGDLTYANLEYVLEAQVTMCRPTQNYQFKWIIEDYTTDVEVTTSDIGSRLLVPPGTLIAGRSYEITCEVRRASDNLFINQMQYSVEVQERGLEVALSSDYLIISTGKTFIIQAEVFNHDHLPGEFNYAWWCNFEGEPCESFESVDSSDLELLGGLIEVGKYEIGVTIKVGATSASAKVIVEAVEPRLPVLEVMPISRIVQEGSRVSLVGNASNIAPSCSLAWYFAPHNYSSDNETCEDCQHGELLSDVVTILSIEENFLNELSDFSNDTEWRQITVEINAGTGRARFLAKCGCSITFNCDTAGMVYADLLLELNDSPIVGGITVTPSSGSALETLFTIRTQGVHDYEPPLRYSFYTKIDDNINLLLDSYLEYVAVETYLPFIDGITEVWVEVCDSLGACGNSHAVTVNVVIEDVVTVEYLIETAEAHLRRCELMELTRISVLAITTFKNAELTEELTTFSARLTEILARGPNAVCRNNHNEHYSLFLDVITSIGIDTTDLE